MPIVPSGLSALIDTIKLFNYSIKVGAYYYSGSYSRDTLFSKRSLKLFLLFIIYIKKISED